MKFDEPSGIEQPEKGFAVEDNGYIPPAEEGSKVEVIVKPDSERLQILKPFDPWNGKDLDKMRLLIKVKGTCTTDHISMAGPWLRYRGHLDNISNNLMIGAVNFFNDQTNSVKNHLTGKYEPVPDTAKSYKKAGMDTIIVGMKITEKDHHVNTQPWNPGIWVSGLSWQDHLPAFMKQT